MSGLLEDTFEDLPDEKPVDPGIYSVRITSAKAKVSKKGNPMIQVSFEIEEEATAKPLFDFFTEPTPSMDDRTVLSNKRRFKSFLEAFGFDISQPIGQTFFESAPGLTGNVQLSYEDDPQYGPSNRIMKYMIDN